LRKKGNGNEVTKFKEKTAPPKDFGQTVARKKLKLLLRHLKEDETPKKSKMSSPNKRSDVVWC
jgi:hypothetical protein